MYNIVFLNNLSRVCMSLNREFCKKNMEHCLGLSLVLIINAYRKLIIISACEKCPACPPVQRASDVRGHATRRYNDIPYTRTFTFNHHLYTST